MRLGKGFLPILSHEPTISGCRKLFHERPLPMASEAEQWRKEKHNLRTSKTRYKETLYEIIMSIMKYYEKKYE